MNKKELHQHLRNIKKMVKSTHWIKERYYCNIKGKDCYCLTGLINHELGLRSSIGSTQDMRKPWIKPYIVQQDQVDKRQEIFDLIMKAIKIKSPRTKAETIEHWNDQSRTTRKDVIEVLDIALKL